MSKLAYKHKAEVKTCVDVSLNFSLQYPIILRIKDIVLMVTMFFKLFNLQPFLYPISKQTRAPVLFSITV